MHTVDNGDGSYTTTFRDIAMTDLIRMARGYPRARAAVRVVCQWETRANGGPWVKRRRVLVQPPRRRRIEDEGDTDA